jgi:CubicO group peptidase (beta-lactamase class C family)
VVLLAALPALGADEKKVFPGKSWERRAPEALALNAGRLEALAEMLGGRGCVIRNGFVAASWGSQSETSDWLSSAKPVLSTLLMFAIHEGKVPGPDARILDFGWDLQGKDQGITFRHLGSMTSGYARPDAPGMAWAYNDYAIQLYQKTLFDKVFRAEPDAVIHDPKRLGFLGFEDGITFRPSNRRMSASVRDFARIVWFWLNKGNWNGVHLLPQLMFEEFVRPQTPPDLPHTAGGETNDYLEIGTFGGGSDHFTNYGAGIYGFNWWFNGKGWLHPGRNTWPDAPGDTVLSIGFGGNCSALIPSLDLILVAAKANWGKLEAGDSDSQMNRVLQLLAGAVER